ncbi:MAG: T9SS type A sorting domain-containing protein [Ignavibacteria bacterium]|nr:T9SS type A sorting domain-containing protein [Ignavibacteria bacterium]
MKKFTIAIYLVLVSLNFTFSQTNWTQTDWSGNQYSSIQNLNPEVNPGELILNNETSNMLYAFTPTTCEGVWDMEVYNEKLFIAACSRPLLINGGDVIAYNYATNTYTYLYQVYEQGIIKMRSYNNKLYIPGVDSRGSWNFGNIYIYNGNILLRKTTVPRALHVFDLIFYNNEMYVSTGTDTINYSAIVYKSTDEGDSWAQVYSVPAVGSGFRRFYMMGIYQNKLYVQSDLEAPQGKVLFRFDGSNWTNIPFDSLVPSVGLLEQFNNKFYFLNGQYLHIYDSNNWITVSLPFSGMYYSSSTWTRIAKGLGFYNNKIYGGGESGILYSSINGTNWQIESDLGNSNYEIESIEVYHGRLYVGINDTSGTGKVFVSASVPAGNLVSLKHDFIDTIKSGVINWNALIPDLITSIKFQIRTAQTESGLDSTAFTGPDGTSQTFYETTGQVLSSVHSGDIWMQYKVYFNTNDSALMPVLQDVTISVSTSGIKSISKNYIDDYCLEQNFPNPFNPITNIKFEIPKSMYTELIVYDIIGKKVTELVNEKLNRGSYVVEWDASEYASGIYFFKLITDEFVDVKKMVLIK